MDTKFWSGIMVGNDGYPMKDEHGWYCIAGSNKFNYFKATTIEIFGMKKKT